VQGFEEDEKHWSPKAREKVGKKAGALKREPKVAILRTGKYADVEKSSLFAKLRATLDNPMSSQ